MRTEAARRRPLSLSLRITALVGVVMTVLFVSFEIQVMRSIEVHFAEQDLGELRAVAESLAHSLEPANAEQASRPLAERVSKAVAGHHGIYFRVVDASGTPVFGNTPAGLYELASRLPPSASLEGKAVRVWSLQDHDYRGALLRMGGATALIAIDMDSHEAYLVQLKQTLWISTLLASFIAVLAAWLAVRWGHAPLRRISATVRGITSENLHVRLDPLDAPLELEPLINSFNQMLDQLQASFERLTHFSADIAHELRTPVTNLTTQTQVALSRAREPLAYREVLYSSLEELDRMGKMISDMLFLAQADHRQSQPGQDNIDLATEILALFDYFEAWAEEAHVRMTLEGAAPIIHGDRLMLQRALSNLISNALRYTPDAHALTARLSEVNGMVEVAVQNTGTEIDPRHLSHLFDRFYRVDPARQHKGEGAGLGLAIVKSVAQAHGGKVDVTSAAGITTFYLRLPTASSAV